MKEQLKEQYDAWIKNAVDDIDIMNELAEKANDEEWIEDAFYQNLSFGTGGLRGIIGAGTNRINIYTIAMASQGLADYIKDTFKKTRAVAISYDTRIKSELFARIAAEVFVANGVEVYIYTEQMPTPCLSYAVRKLKCSAGIMITASHNPAQYNGYKVYDSDGCQITEKVASRVSAEISKLNIFRDIKRSSFEEEILNGKIHYISDEVLTAFIEEVKAQSLLGDKKELNRDIVIVYSPLNGTGLKPVLRVLNETGYTDIMVVKEQEAPDGLFPTCPYPNPETDEAMELGIEYAERYHADIFLATDPDCDRVGVAAKTVDGQYRLLSGNEVGLLLLDYVCSRLKAMDKMPEKPVFIKTIVTSELAEKIAQAYDVRTINVLTGFKYIGEQIAKLEASGEAQNYIMGFEESCGYLRGTYVRDKDGVNASFLICEMLAYYKAHNIGLWQRLEELYKIYGYCLDTLHSYKFAGPAGSEKMQNIMDNFRKGITRFGEQRVIRCLDYKKGIEGLPKANVLKFFLENDRSIVIRPSGTEPKMKAYISVSAKDKTSAIRIENVLVKTLENYIYCETLTSG